MTQPPSLPSRWADPNTRGNFLPGGQDRHAAKNTKVSRLKFAGHVFFISIALAGIPAGLVSANVLGWAFDGTQALIGNGIPFWAISTIIGLPYLAKAANKRRHGLAVKNQDIDEHKNEKLQAASLNILGKIKEVRRWAIDAVRIMIHKRAVPAAVQERLNQESRDDAFRAILRNCPKVTSIMRNNKNFSDMNDQSRGRHESRKLQEGYINNINTAPKQ